MSGGVLGGRNPWKFFGNWDNFDVLTAILGTERQQN